ncbi:uncharacterized protein [Musca autumnalis]|uniref:uncharacterized protein n=1 Tax=Musca autumnalis TaxID=221902 RepID=UPI003CEB4138
MDNENEFLKEFLCCYEMQRCLWDITSPEYMMRDIKTKAYGELLNVMKKYKKDCSIDDVKKKINVIRSSYRRELKKIKQSESSGAGVDSVYQPKIWWFDACKFLQSYEKPTGSISTLSEDDLLKDSPDDIVCEPSIKTKRSIKQNSALDAALSYLQKESDSFDLAGKTWASRLRKMDSTQSKLADRLINEIIFQGKLKMLTMDSSVQIRKALSTIGSTQSEIYRNTNHFSNSKEHQSELCSTSKENRSNNSFRNINRYTNTHDDESLLSSTPKKNRPNASFRNINHRPNTPVDESLNSPDDESFILPCDTMFTSSLSEPVSSIDGYEEFENNSNMNLKKFFYSFK